MDINVFKILKKTRAEGPGQRFCIWVQGCSRHCKGCFAKSTWSHKENLIFPVNELFEMICAQKDIEGVTFLGGEPFEQAKSLSLLAKKIKDTGLSLVTFTGNIYEKLKDSESDGVRELLAQTDLLIDGAFEENCFDLERPWVGSSNQRYLFLSNRYSLKDILNAKNKIEVRINKTGAVFVNGMTDFNSFKNVLQ